MLQSLFHTELILSIYILIKSKFPSLDHCSETSYHFKKYLNITYEVFSLYESKTNPSKMKHNFVKTLNTGLKRLCSTYV